MGPEFLIFGLVMPLVQRLGDRWLDAIAEEIDEGLRFELKRLVSATSTADPELRRQHTARAQQELKSYIEHDRAAEAQLAEVARQPKVAVPPASNRRLARLAQYRAFLLVVFDLVAKIGRPVALPGFFNCTTCVTVIDARTGGLLGSLADPLVEEPQHDPPRIWLAAGPSAARDAVELGKPRLWIMRTADADGRDALIAEIHERFSLPEDQLPSPVVLEYDLPKNPPAELVGSVFVDRIAIERQQPLERDVIKVFTAPPDQADTDPFYRISPPPEGIRLLRSHLERLLQEQWDIDEEFRDALVGS